MMDIVTTINTAHSAIKIAKESLTLLLNSKVEEKSREKINEAMLSIGNLQDTLFEIRNELFQLQTERDGFKKELEQRDNWDRKIAEYKLIRAPGGGMVYAYQGEPSHYICPKCIVEQEIQILQDQKNEYTGSFQCPGCDKHYNINVPVEPPETGFSSVYY